MGTETYFTGFSFVVINKDCICYDVFKFLNTAFNKSLLFFCRDVISIFTQVTLLNCNA